MALNYKNPSFLWLQHRTIINLMIC